jgi:hypothetical protein
MGLNIRDHTLNLGERDKDMVRAERELFSEQYLRV